MKEFLSILFILYFGLTSSNWAAEVDPNEPIDAEFNPEASWSDMHNYAQQRAEWFRQTLEVLTNEKGDVQRRLTLAKKIMPGLDETEVKVSAGLSLTLQKKLQVSKLIDATTSDVLYSFLYWDFLERTLAFYNTAPNNTLESRNALLPYLFRELEVFGAYAVADLTDNPQSRYYSEEFFINGAIIQECKDLASHQGCTVVQLMHGIDEETKEVIDLTPSELSYLYLESALKKYNL
jgi:hypothetical protein